MDWTLQYRQRVDVITTRANIRHGRHTFSRGGRPRHSELIGRGRVELRTSKWHPLRVEAGANRLLAPSYAKAFAAGDHYSSLGASAPGEVVSGALLLHGGQSQGGDFEPLRGIAGAITIKPSERLILSATVDWQAPLRHNQPQAFGVSANVGVRF